MSLSSTRSVAEPVFEILPNGEPAWLRPVDYAEADDATSTLTQLGEDLVRREAAMQACFGPAPTIAEACGLARGTA